jgi:hypothetical protein
MAGGSVNKRGFARRAGMAALAMSALDPLVAADAPAPVPIPPAAAPQKPALDEQLDEVLVEGRRTTDRPKRPGFRDYQEPFDFLARLVGRFVIDGQVDLHAMGRAEDLRKVSGGAECVGFGTAPGVQCEMSVRWPETAGPGDEAILGGVSTFNPAMLLFGFEPLEPDPGTIRIGNMVVRLPQGISTPPEPAEAGQEFPGISWIILDSKGIADTATGLMITPATMQSRAKCRGIAGNCERVTRITAASDLTTVDMRIDLEIDEVVAVRYRFVMHRVPGTGSMVYGRKPDKQQTKKK